MSRCGDDQKMKYTVGSFVGKALTWWNSQIHTRGRETAVAMEPTTIQKAMQKAGTLIDETIRNGSLKRNHERIRNGGEPNIDKNVNDDNKRTRTGNAFATTANPVRREYTSAAPKCANCNLHHSPETPFRACFNYNCIGHLAKDCRVVPRVVNLANVRNPTAAHGACYKCGVLIISRQHPLGTWKGIYVGNRGGSPGPKHCDGTFTLNNHYTTTLFDSGANYNFVSTTFIPLLGIELSNLGHVFDIDLIPFARGSFDMIIGMDWLSKHKAEIICHEKVVKIPIQMGKVLRVIGERLEEKVKHLMSAKAKEQKQEEIAVVRNFPEVFPDDLSGLPPTQEI
uniref:Reverse transcriptase domain-containing protein n=1 Tax=Tanacetum cinerariifolium TaxID=118510 RepID=A0A699JKQ2_TANCI|nr:hypothetical protein [Tanacetum cinerariifolium]